jgi:hypothetical protein
VRDGELQHGRNKLKTQVSTTRARRSLRFSAALFLALLPLLPAYARVHHNNAWARQQFAKAERSHGLSGVKVASKIDQQTGQ